MTPKSKFLHAGLLLFGVLCGSTAVIMIKASTEHPFLVASYRLLVAALALSPMFWRDYQKAKGTYGWRQFGWSAVPGIILAVHFMSWVVGARMTQVANASLIANLTPVAMPFFLWLAYQERVNRTEILGTGFTLAGLVALSLSSLHIDETSFKGDLICFGSMLAFAAYLALGRRNGSRLPLWLYMVPLYAVAGLVSLICALFFINPIKTYTLNNVLLIIGLGLIPTVFGHTILNYSMKFFRGQVVSVVNLTQPVYAGILGFLLFQEVPQPAFYGSASLIVIGVLIVLFANRKEQSTQPPSTLDKVQETALPASD